MVGSYTVAMLNVSIFTCQERHHQGIFHTCVSPCQYRLGIPSPSPPILMNPHQVKQNPIQAQVVKREVSFRVGCVALRALVVGFAKEGDLHGHGRQPLARRQWHRPKPLMAAVGDWRVTVPHASTPPPRQNGYGSKRCNSGEHQNRWYMGVHPPEMEP